jgi:hypothetical protein
MIDNYEQTMLLIERMEQHLPIPARPTKTLTKVLQGKGLRIMHNQKLFIKRVFYMGDEGGISCDITPEGKEKEPIICSITHIRVKPSHPLAAEIRAYQTERQKRLAQANRGGPPTYFTVEPRKKRNR